MQDFVIAAVLLLYAGQVVRLSLKGMHVQRGRIVMQMREPVQHRHRLAIRQGQRGHQSEGEASQCLHHAESYQKRGGSQRNLSIPPGRCHSSPVRKTSPTTRRQKKSAGCAPLAHTAQKHEPDAEAIRGLA